MKEDRRQQSSTDPEQALLRQDLSATVIRRITPASVGSAAVAAASVAVTAVTAVPMSLPIVGPIVKRIRHKAPDQRVMIINESPEESCTHALLS